MPGAPRFILCPVPHVLPCALCPLVPVTGPDLDCLLLHPVCLCALVSPAGAVVPLQGQLQEALARVASLEEELYVHRSASEAELHQVCRCGRITNRWLVV